MNGISDRMNGNESTITVTNNSNIRHKRLLDNDEEMKQIVDVQENLLRL